MKIIRNIFRDLQFGWGIKKRLFENQLVESCWEMLAFRKRLQLPTYPWNELVPERIGHVQLCPDRINAWETHHGDAVVICSLCKMVEPKRILEIGTCHGLTTIHLAMNALHAEIDTYDIDTSAGRRIFQSPESMKSRIRVHLKNVHDDRQALLEGDRFDFVFIDGSHKEEHVEKDSLLALEIISADGIVAWHDYSRTGGFTGSNAVPEVLARLAKERVLPLYGIEGSNVAALIPGRYLPSK